MNRVKLEYNRKSVATDIMKVVIAPIESTLWYNYSIVTSIRHSLVLGLEEWGTVLPQV